MSRKWRYEGFTKEHENVLFCEVCNVNLVLTAQGNSRQCIDHDHSTGKFRGVLCSSCNKMLGGAKDNPEILRLGAKYLEERTS